MEEKKTNELNDETLDAVTGGGVKRARDRTVYCINCGKDVEPDRCGCCPNCGKQF